MTASRPPVALYPIRKLRGTAGVPIDEAGAELVPEPVGSGTR
ncbi:hypothetical protein [Actinomadura sp. 7K534]|nr:hypothetical protein [Actinomadura sp. 7K534]